MTQKSKSIQNKIKETIRRVVFFPFFIFSLPFVWLLLADSFKDLWKEFFEITEVGEQ